MRKFNWQGHEWIVGEYWCETHSQFPLSWYDPAAVKIDNSKISLGVTNNQKYIYIDGAPCFRKFGVGRVNCNTEFKYGKFEWTFKLPKGSSLWPALWLQSYQSWPPEIDCIEGWSNDTRATYSKRIFWVNIHPTCHWKGLDGEHLSRGVFNTPKTFIKENKINTCSIEWRKDSIKVFYNNKLKGEWTEPLLLKQLNDENAWMHPTMDVDLQSNFTYNDFDKYCKKGCRV